MICQNESQLFLLMILSTSTLVTVVYYLNGNAGYIKQMNAISKIKFDTSKVKKRYLLTVGVLSKPSAKERRMAIRKTWFTVCKDNTHKVLCKFFTDLPPKSERSERTEFKDLEYMPYKGGFNFALNLIWILKYFTRYYDFDFFLRVDDDYFVCLHHLLTELPQRRPATLYWGWVHCIPNIVRVDEGFMILTYDIVKESLDRYNTTLMCSGTGDQAVAMWMGTSKLKVTYFVDNDRLIHRLPAPAVKNFLVSGICDRYIGLHQAYPQYMYQYWEVLQKDIKERKNNTSTLNSTSYVAPPIKDFYKICTRSKKFDWRGFGTAWRFEPKPCKDEPRWRNGAEFAGRQG